MAEQPQLVLPPISDPSILAEIDKLARRYIEARGLAMEIIERIGGGGEQLMKRLPGFMRSRIDRGVETALRRTFRVASASRGVLRDRGDWFNRMGTTAAGAVGGAAGLTGAVVELPVTVTILLRAILEIADEHGFDTRDDRIQAEALRVFASGGPLAEDDSTDTGLLAARLTVSGRTLQALITSLAPQIATRLIAKVGAQAVPVLGAVAGASINYTFARYYQNMARVHFGLLRLSQETGLSREALTERLQTRIDVLEGKHPPARKA
ncbi:EcsC family protein [Paracoccus aerodenitrificans]|uniref:EcsC family protein n=1 Tax=Paracoccus aerodenitrificans TaxID=3017781 RepID=UPI0022EFDA02|nr:EcsC family protein [Paracoccus aerodenitrificans]WBU63204.1 EcsC family protein [Paracoccus aerodenitrificans]